MPISKTKQIIIAMHQSGAISEQTAVTANEIKEIVAFEPAGLIFELRNQRMIKSISTGIMHHFLTASGISIAEEIIAANLKDDSHADTADTASEAAAQVEHHTDTFKIAQANAATIKNIYAVCDHAGDMVEDGFATLDMAIEQAHQLAAKNNSGFCVERTTIERIGTAKPTVSTVWVPA